MKYQESNVSDTKQSYHDLKIELNQIIDNLQDSDIAVDVALQKYKQGLEIIEKLQAQLHEAENTITKLQSKFEKAS